MHITTGGNVVYSWLERYEIGPLNIEGAFRVGATELWLVQRGNHAGSRNGIVVLNYRSVCEDLEHRLPHVGARCWLHSIDIPCPKIGGMRATLTDGCTLPNWDVLLSAAAEATDDSYADGPCQGSLLLRCAASGGRPPKIYHLTGKHKFEGVAAAGKYLWLVSDDDDRARPAGLYRLPLDSLE